MLTLLPGYVAPAPDDPDDDPQTGPGLTGMFTHIHTTGEGTCNSDSGRRDQPSFCRTLLRISPERRGSFTARASTTPPIIAAVQKIASFRSAPLAERKFSSPCSNAALSSGVERATSWASAAMVQPSPGLSRCHGLRYRSANDPLLLFFFFLLRCRRPSETFWP